MNRLDIEQLNEYKIISKEFIEEVNSWAVLLKHKKSGARIALLSNDDNNKVFHIAFRTPVSDDTGKPHIIEHTVLCGSKKYPVKDPFMELVKGSLNTFLNAITYGDKTMYPVASTNDKDFKNLMEVYMDAVFNPNIYNEEKIFKQEGWHYEIENVDAPLTYNGIVYNEMKGVYSSPDGVLDRITLQSLFPDTTYRFESGGAPESIPELTYEEYLNFHKKYYHPSNSYIYLYGDMDMKEKLQWLDKEYLRNYSEEKVESEIEFQKPFEQMVEKTGEFAITDGEKTENNSILELNYVIGKSEDNKLDIALKIIDYALMDVPGAPLKQAIIDAGIGTDVYSEHAHEMRQIIFSIIAKSTDENKKQEFINIVDTTLKDIVKNGINKKALIAGINYQEFKTRESDFGRYPKGLMYGLEMMKSWLYNDELAFELLKTNKIYQEMKELVDTDYFEKVITECFINNNHKSVITLVPKKGLAAKEEQRIAKELAKKKAAMSREEIEQLVKETKELKEYQETPSTKEELECVPLLELSDIKKETDKDTTVPETVDETLMLYHNLFTNGIGYLDINFRCDDVSPEYFYYIGLLKYLLGYMDTQFHSYNELNTIIDTNLGGLGFDTSVIRNIDKNDIYYGFQVHAKMLYEKIPNAFELIEEIVCHTEIDNKKRLKEILGELKSRLQMSIVQRGDSVGMGRVLSYYSKASYMKECTTGLEFYEFIKETLKNFDEKYDELVSKLQLTVKYIFRSERMIINYCGNKISYENVKKLALDFKTKMFSENVPVYNWEFKPLMKDEGFKTSGQVQYVVRGGKFDIAKNENVNGKMSVLGQIMRCEYLWNNIRVLGGAYGCNIVFSRGGDIIFSSYRDPNLENTNNVYLKAPEYISKFDADEREMRKYIIGVIGVKDTPLMPSDRSLTEFVNYMAGIDFEKREKDRKAILETTVNDIRKLAPLFKEAMEHSGICVMGSESSVDNAKDLFKEIKNFE